MAPLLSAHNLISLWSAYSRILHQLEADFVFVHLDAQLFLQPAPDCAVLPHPTGEWYACLSE
jgi:hypothetical protein